MVGVGCAMQPVIRSDSVPDGHGVGRIVDPGFAVDAVRLREHVFDRIPAYQP